jgi:hypothetical protein
MLTGVMEPVKPVFAYNVPSMLEASDMGTAILLLHFWYQDQEAGNIYYHKLRTFAEISRRKMKFTAQYLKIVMLWPGHQKHLSWSSLT